MITFWRPSDKYGFLGQWKVSPFKLTEQIIESFPDQIVNLNICADKKKSDFFNIMCSINHTFNTAEQFMMMGKAALFGDIKIFIKLSCTTDPDAQRKLGRRVKNFSQSEWDYYCCDIVKIGNYLKFTQNNDLNKLLKATKGYTLVEGSPYDKIWGVGIRFNDPLIFSKNNWKGTNYLGLCLEFIRDSLE